MKLKTNLLAAVLVCCLASCGGRPPRIAQLFYQRNLFKDRELGEIYEKISLFVLPDDPDGLEDLESLFLIHDEHELFWSLDSNTWQEPLLGGETWIGSNAIVMPDGSELPDGTYRAVLRDLSGEVDEAEFVLTGTGIQKGAGPFPTTSVEDSRVFANSPYGVTEIWVYDVGSRFRSSFLAQEQGIPLETILSQVPNLSPGFHYFVYAFDADRRVGLVAGPFFP
jgi:hypothetical protein